MKSRFEKLLDPASLSFMRFVILTILIVGIAIADDDVVSTIVTKSGETYLNAKITGYEKRGARISHEGGIRLIEIEDLPDELLLSLLEHRIRSISADAEVDVHKLGLKFSESLMWSSNSFGTDQCFRIEGSKYCLYFYTANGDPEKDQPKIVSLRIVEATSEEVVVKGRAATKMVYTWLYPEWSAGFGASEKGVHLQWIRNGSPVKDGRPLRPSKISEETLQLLRESEVTSEIVYGG